MVFITLLLFLSHNYFIVVPNFFFFFFYISTQEGEWGIRTSDLRFMRPGLQAIVLPLGNYCCTELISEYIEQINSLFYDNIRESD